jgi:TolB-like protein/Flp pilus assembly protein TadD
MQKLLDELRRRNVFRVTIAYLVAGWMILQVVDVFAGVLGLPDWTLRLVGFLVVLGLPLVIMFSWVFELTPDGLRREKDLLADPAAARYTGRRLNLVIVLLLVIAVPLTAAQLIQRGGIGTLFMGDSAPRIQSRVNASGIAVPEYNSVAVLPFVNISADPDSEYFSDGLTEELLNLLSRVRGLRVPSRTSSFYYKGRNTELAVIGRELGVEHVLEGSVRKAGDQLRISVKLIDVKTDTPLWSESYDRRLSDIFNIQDDIAGRIVEALRLSLGGRVALSERSHPTENMQAYELYLQGLRLFNERGTGLAAAVELLRQAVTLDPQYADAWATLAAVYAVLPSYEPADSQQAYEQARGAAMKALELDPSEPLAQAALALSGIVDRGGDWPPQWSASFELFDQAIAQHPQNATLRTWYGVALLQTGYLEAGAIQMLAAYRLDPASALNNDWLGVAYMMTGKLDKAVAHFMRARELGRDVALNNLRMLYFQMGLYDRVLDPQPEVGDAIPLDWWEALVAARQDAGKGQELISLTKLYSARPANRPTLDAGLIELGLFREYLGGMRADFAANYAVLVSLWNPWNARLRQSGEFQELIRYLGLPDLWQARGWPDLCGERDGEIVCQ